jgi:hypothetical protein
MTILSMLRAGRCRLVAGVAYLGVMFLALGCFHYIYVLYICKEVSKILFSDNQIFRKRCGC